MAPGFPESPFPAAEAVLAGPVRRQPCLFALGTGRALRSAMLAASGVGRCRTVSNGAERVSWLLLRAAAKQDIRLKSPRRGDISAHLSTHLSTHLSPRLRTVDVRKSG
ncbi:hypothetical protein GCM10010449_20640 [Streptomyces rectiviolaceus]|uniref:Uncharacterized protein n=1 Tax=Streptomyces rectiviolaceus TaxID=332591 RepID=A0ABP6MDT6_9ACTN